MSDRPAAPGGLRVALLSGAPVWRGSSASYAKVAIGLAQRGHETLVLVDDADIAARMTQEGARSQYVAIRDTGLGEFGRLRDALARLRPQVLMADRPRDLRLAAIATLGWPTRIVYRYNLAHRRYPRDPMSRFALWRTAAVVFQSRAVRRMAYDRTPRLRNFACARVPNGIDTARFRPDPEAGSAFRRSLGIADDADVVVQSTAVAKGKGHDLTIAALVRLRSASSRPLVLVVAGEGKLLEQVRTEAARVGLDAHFPGALPPDGLRAALCAADVVIHPSEMEIFPTAVAEAMACGCAIVATDTGGTAEVTGRSGRAARLVPVGDVSALSQAVGTLLADAPLRAAMGEAARERVQRRFPLDAMLDGYESLFRSLIDRA